MNKFDTNVIPSVNYHLWRACNANCGFCFATFEDSKGYIPKGHLSEEESIRIIDEIISAGFKKITFAGGEPTLCKWLPKLIKRAKLGGLTTMIVTNGFMLSNNYLKKLRGSLDWIAISIDSISSETNRKTGRNTRQMIPDEDFYRKIILNIKKNEFRLKINTVVSKSNYLENLNDFIISTKPDRWKVFQTLLINGQNSNNISEFEVSDMQFQMFMDNHASLENYKINVVFEKNEDMLKSYVMIDPAGRFYGNSGKKYVYSAPILEVGIIPAYSQIEVIYQKFLSRQGLYDWEKRKTNQVSTLFAWDKLYKSQTSLTIKST